MLLNALICYSNALKVLMQSGMPLCQWNSSKKGTDIGPIQTEELLAYSQHTKFAPLCRINYLSHRIYFFSDWWPSLEVFDNISKNKISLTDAVLLKLQFLHQNRNCAKLMELFDLKMNWTSSVGYGQTG